MQVNTLLKGALSDSDNKSNPINRILMQNGFTCSLIDNICVSMVD